MLTEKWTGMDNLDTTDKKQMRMYVTWRNRLDNKYRRWLRTCDWNKAAVMHVYVTAYFEDHVYGGPEEGGWYFTACALQEVYDLGVGHKALRKALKALEFLERSNPYRESGFGLKYVIEFGVPGREDNTDKPIFWDR